MRHRYSPALLLLSLAVTASPAAAELKLPAVISDGMVLQQQTGAPLWGFDDPGTEISVVASWASKPVTTRADDDGRWQVKLRTPAAGGPFTLQITGSEERTLANILVGEVWICSGQSNMEWSMTQSSGAGAEIPIANHPRLRLFDVKNRIAREPLDDVEGKWQRCSPESVSSFSAVGYYFGRDLLQNLPACADGGPMPIGLIAPNWGGTVVESWTSREGLSDFSEFDPFFEELAQRAEAESDLSLEQSRWWTALEQKEVGLLGGWSRGELDDSWQAAPVPGSFADWGQGSFDGCMWYRCTIELPDSMAGSELVLELGAVDDMDMTFLDGEPIGATRQDGNWNTQRRYTIPASMATEGSHELAVCAVDTGGLGVVGGANGHARLRAGDEVLDLAGTWSARPGTPLSELGEFPRRSWFHQNRPTALYNGMIAPLIPYAVQGAIWYQGESNRGRAAQYRRLFPALIEDWRNHFGDELTFLWVQLAPFGYGGDRGELSELREAQTLALSLPRTGQAVTMDIGNPADIHPRNKHDVGRRLARWARARTYGEEDLTFSGPVYQGITREGNTLQVRFEHGDGLRTRNSQPPSCFQVAGEDRVYHDATARIDGEVVVVSSKAVEKPIAVRYGWGATDEPNLENAAKLPAGSFRSDDWPLVSSLK